MTRPDDSMIRRALRNEVTWILIILGIFWGAVKTVVLPLQSMQIQISQIQTSITSQVSNYETLTKLVNQIDSRTSVLESRLNSRTITGGTIQSQ